MVVELREQARKSDVSLTELLRTALCVADLLDLSEFRQWIELCSKLSGDEA
ncbi:hypothetical protein HS125_17230 [bacterium]|nr:hypothetical protein [bacterium]